MTKEQTLEALMQDAKLNELFPYLSRREFLYHEILEAMDRVKVKKNRGSLHREGKGRE